MMQYLPIIVAVGAFVVVILILLGMYQFAWVRAKKRALVDKIQESGQPATVIDVYSSPPPGGPAGSRVLNFLGFVGQRVARRSVGDHSRLRPVFLRAGIRWRNAPSVFWGCKVVLAVLLPIGLLGARIAYPATFAFSHTWLVGIAVFLGTAGFYLPDFWLRIKISRRKEKIREGFADALDLMVVCVEAGMGLDAALNRVAREIRLDNRVLSEELGLVTLELRAGKLRRDALKNLAMRTDLEDVNSLVTLLIQADKLGTGIGTALRVFSDSFRTKRYQRAEEQAAKIPVKLVIPLILFIFPTLLVVIMGPAGISIYRTLLPVLGG